MFDFLAPFYRRILARAIILSLALAMVTLSVIGVVGMTLSVVLADKVRGSGSAINVAGSLRMQSHRMGGLVLASMMEDTPDLTLLRDAMVRFEASLRHPSLMSIHDREPGGAYAGMLRKVQTDWATDLKPLLTAHAERVAPLSSDRHRELLARLDAYVADINSMVAQLEADTEARINQLHTLLGVSLVLTFLVMIGVLYGVSKRVIMPLNRLVDAANGIAQGDFSARVRHIGADELGRVGVSFNFMADELSKLYGRLEQRVNEKTEQLTRSNRSLELLYHSIARLYNAPVAEETYREMLHGLEQVLGLRHSMACLLPGVRGMPRILATTLNSCPGRGMCENIVCADCASHDGPWQHIIEGNVQVRSIPLKDSEQQYGVLHITLPQGRDLEPWQEQLIEALSQHIGIAIGSAHQSEQERRLALMDERSAIARELHDSLAQALSYMKIQVVLLQQALASEANRGDAEHILKDLREGINAAYRQLRELLATFRLRMEGDFHNLLSRTAEEYSRRGDLLVILDARIGNCRLSPNQEIHVLQIVREALNNVVRHAHAAHAWVDLSADERQTVTVTIEDDGQGLPEHLPATGHYGLTIMRERAQSLSGELSVMPRPERGTRVHLRFEAGDGRTHSAFSEVQA
jgi:two-component system nitrate/nitrite sensor histidine kinase NarX